LNGDWLAAAPLLPKDLFDEGETWTAGIWEVQISKPLIHKALE